MARETSGDHTRGPRKVGVLTPWALALLAAVLISPLVLADRILVDASNFSVGEAAPVTLRTSPLQESGFAAGAGVEGGGIAIARGDVVDAQQSFLANSQSSPSPGTWLLALLGVGCLILAWSAYLKGSPKGSLLRQQLVIVGTVFVFALLVRGVLLFTSVSILAMPVALVGLLVGRRSSRGTAVASALVAATLVAFMVPFAPGIFAVLALQAAVPLLLLCRFPARLRLLLAVLAAGALSALAYAAAYYAAWRSFPSLADPLRSTWLAAPLGAVLSGGLVIALTPVYDWLCGEVSARTLNRLERLSQPLLRELSEKAPGTWQHSLAMANLAEAAARSIGADAQLLRVGAYYHDLGKALEPNYFIENSKRGEPSLHDKLSATASRDGIFKHVTEGIRVAREAKLPERVIDFIRSHHGGGLLEYFWTKEQQGTQGTRAEFCYPGIRPQCPETGILCICDAVEAAARNLKSPSDADVDRLVHHIVFGKAGAGQLDACGLSLPDLQSIRRALSETLISAHAPNERRVAGEDAISTAPERPAARGPGTHGSTVDQLDPIRLDSLDMPNSHWRQVRARQDSAAPSIALAATESIDDGIAFSPTESIESEKKVSEEHSAEALESRRTSELRAAEPLERRTLKREVAASESERRTLERAAEAAPDRQNSDLDVEDMPTPNIETVALGRPKGDSLVPPVDAIRADADEPLLLQSPKQPARQSAKPPALGPASLAGIPVAQRASAGPDNLRVREWKDALGSTKGIRPLAPPLHSGTKGSPPTPPPAKRETIPLGGEESQVLPAQIAASRSGLRADSQDGLKPGEMVIGPPPATHPERSRPRAKAFDDVTVQRPIPLPDEARRPEDRITEEQLAFVPPEAFPETTIPTQKRPGSESGDSD